jgi:hypothetical protein
MRRPKYGTIGLIVLLVSAIAATTGLANIKTSPAFAHEEHSDFMTNVEYIKGHLQQAIANKQAGSTDLAVAHATHPIEEVFALMQGPLEGVSPQRAADLQEELEALPNTIQSDTLQTLTQKVDDINAMMDEAVVVYAGEEAEELATKVAVIVGLLETAGVEYSEAVEDGEIIEMIEYQDASAFIDRANVTFASIQSEINATEAEEITGFFDQLSDGLAVNADPEDVQTLLDGIIHEMEEVVPSGNEHVDFMANLEYIRGHLAQALANKQANNIELAAAHAGHPVHEVYALIEGELAEHDPELNEELEQELTTLANQINSMTVQQVQTEVANLNTILDGAEAAAIGESEREDPAFRAMVAIALLETADLEYAEAVEDGQIIEMIEYQDSTAFITRAKSIFESIEAEMPEEEAEEVDELFVRLDNLTASNASVEEVGTVLDGISHEFEEAFGLEEEDSGYDGQAYINTIIELLDEAVVAYQAGDAQEAKALAIEAYLDNYEFIEADIEEDDAELMEKIEVDIREELVEMIDGGRPASEIASHVDMIKADLETARALVTTTEEPHETPDDHGPAAEGQTGFITNAEYIRGHLEQAIANKQTNQTELAIAHAGHPIEEVFTLMEGPLGEVDQQMAVDLKTALEALPNSIQSDTAQVVSQKVTDISDMLDEAVQAFAGEEADALNTKVGVIKGLLETAGLEYSEAVENGEIIEMIEFQDASAFISRANAMFETIQAEIDAEEAEEIADFFEQLDSSLQAKSDPANVQTLLDGIAHELDEAAPSSGGNVEFAANLEYIRGHLAKAVENKQANNTELAIAHAGHPVEEVYTLIEAAIQEQNATLNTELEESLTSLANQIDTMTLEQVQTEVSEITEMLDQAESAVLGDEMGEPEFAAQVAIAVLETAQLEYSEAVEDGQIVEMIEYQDSAAFIAQAKGIFESIKAEMPEHEAEEVVGFFEQLDSLTASNATPEQVETVIGGIIHEFEEVFGLESDEEVELDGWGYIDKIKELLDESVAAYEGGDAQQAKALAIEAYLENYEFIEADIAQENRTLMEEIEVDMRVELVQMIDDSAPAAEVEEHVNQIKTNLEVARAVVTPEFPFAIVAIAATMTLVVAMVRFRGLRLTSSF